MQSTCLHGSKLLPRDVSRIRVVLLKTQCRCAQCSASNKEQSTADSARIGSMKVSTCSSLTTAALVLATIIVIARSFLFNNSIASWRSKYVPAPRPPGEASRGLEALSSAHNGVLVRPRTKRNILRSLPDSKASRYRFQ